MPVSFGRFHAALQRSACLIDPAQGYQRFGEPPVRITLVVVPGEVRPQVLHRLGVLPGFECFGRQAKPRERILGIGGDHCAKGFETRHECRKKEDER